MTRSRRAQRGLEFGRRELLDLGAAWLALGVAFAIFVEGGGPALVRSGRAPSVVVVSLLSAGVGFLLHELAHKVVAVRYGQVARFRADYGMLFLAVAASLGGFLFFAPGAVVHRGRITERQNGLIALAGPATNLALTALFAPLLAVPVPVVATLGAFGVGVNAFLAAFNMLPFGPLDGRTVLSWSRGAFAGSFVVSLGVAVGAFLVLFA